MNFNGYASQQLSGDDCDADGHHEWLRMARDRDPPLQLAKLLRQYLAMRKLAGSSSNVCRANVGSMAVWSAADNSVYGGPDAGGSSIVATSGDPVQWWNSVVNNYADPNCGGCNTAFQHALRTTLGNQMISARMIPPASLYAAGGHPRMQLASCTATNPIQCTSNYNLGTSGLDGCE